MQASDGSCEVGFFQKNVPMGKYCMYNADGTYRLHEGLYEGRGQCKSKIDIQNYLMQSSINKNQNSSHFQRVQSSTEQNWDEEMLSNFEKLDVGDAK